MKGFSSSTSELLKICCRALDAKKAEDLRVLDVSAQSSITDFLVLATGTSQPHLRALRTYGLMQERNISKREASLETGYGVDRDYGVGAQILHDLGLRRIQLLTNHPPKVAALEGFALEVVGNVPLGQPSHLRDFGAARKHEMSNEREQTA